MASATAALTWWSLIVDTFAVAAIARFLAVEKFPPVLRLRQRLDARSWRLVQEKGRDENWGKLWTCPRCAGFWIALVVVACHLTAAGVWGATGNAVFLALMAPWAVSYAAGLLQGVADRHEADG